jgi:hypothetical protein
MGQLILGVDLKGKATISPGRAPVSEPREFCAKASSERADGGRGAVRLTVKFKVGLSTGKPSSQSHRNTRARRQPPSVCGLINLFPLHKAPSFQIACPRISKYNAGLLRTGLLRAKTPTLSSSFLGG